VVEFSNFLIKIKMLTRNLFNSEDSFLFPKRVVRIEANESFDQAQNYESLAQRLNAEYVPIQGVEISFKKGDTLVQKIMDEAYGDSLPQKQARNSSILIAAKMARAAKTNNLPGFDIDNFKAGDSVKFLQGDKVEVTYSPRGSREKTTVVLDLSDEAAHEGVVHETREALRGTRLEVFQETLRRMNVYNLTGSLGYSWGNQADKGEFLDKVHDLGYDRSRMGDMETPQYRGELCKFIQSKIAEEGPAEIFNQLKADSLELSDEEIAAIHKANENWTPSQGFTDYREGEEEELPPIENVAEHTHTVSTNTQAGIDAAAAEFDAQAIPERERSTQQTEDEVLAEVLDYITPEELQSSLKSALREDFHGISVNVGVDQKTGRPTNPQLTLTGPAGTASAYVTNPNHREDLGVWEKNARKTARELVAQVGNPERTAEAKDARMDALNRDWETNVWPQVKVALEAYNVSNGTSIEFFQPEAKADGTRTIMLRLGSNPPYELVYTNVIPGRKAENYSESKFFNVDQQKPYKDLVKALTDNADYLVKTYEAKDHVDMNQDWTQKMEPKIAQTLQDYSTEKGVNITSSSRQISADGARVLTLHLGDDTFDLNIKAPRLGKGYNSRMFAIGAVAYGNIEDAVWIGADMLVKQHRRNEKLKSKAD